MAKTFFGKLLAIFGNAFSHVFRGAKKTYDNLSDEEKAALLHGSGVISIINTEVGKTPAEIRDSILATYPDLDLPKLENGLFIIAHAFNLVPQENNIEDIIAKLQAYLSNLKGNIWESISHDLAGLLSIVFAPVGSKFGALISLLEYVYHKYIKKDA